MGHYTGKTPLTQQWKIHGVTGFSSEPDKREFSYRHFRGINTNWTFDRTTSEPIESRYAIDALLIANMKRAFGDSFVSMATSDIPPAISFKGNDQ
ncbi:hypothetical protein GCM10028812_52810 [Ancylobacter sonchi]